MICKELAIVISFGAHGHGVRFAVTLEQDGTDPECGRSAVIGAARAILACCGERGRGCDAGCVFIYSAPLAK